MSNSIWKMPDQKPERNEDILVEYTSTNGQSYYIVDSLLNKLLQPKRWAYLSDIIAQADKAKRLQKQLDSLKKYSDSLRHRVEKMLKKNKTLKNTAADYFMKSIELSAELEKTKSNN